jgi:hypothetical protein
VAVLLEDAAAVFGLGIAMSTREYEKRGKKLFSHYSLGCLGLTLYFNDPTYDAIGSVAVGGLLGICAIILVHRNKDALIGTA